MTSPDTRPSWSERANPRNWTLLVKLVVVGLVPALLALGLGVLRITDQAGEAADLEANAPLLEARQQVVGAADALRSERDQAALFVAADGIGDAGAVQSAAAETDAELAALRTALDGRAAQVPDAVDGLAELRDSVLTAPASSLVPEPTEPDPAGTDETGTDETGTDEAVPAPDSSASDAVITQYSDVVAQIDLLEGSLLRDLRTPELTGLAEALTATTAAREALALEHTLLGTTIRSSQVSQAVQARAGVADSAFVGSLAAFRAPLSADQTARFGDYVADPAGADRTRVRSAILNTPADRPVVVTPATWDTAYQNASGAVDSTAEAVRAELTGASAAAQERASNQAGLNSVILLLGLLLAGAIMFLVARALIRSLSVLRTSALDVAQRRLPEAVRSMRSGETPDVAVDPVPLTSRDEVGQVARAFDAVHGQAVRLAADQAALQAGVSSMFVNLSRRSQALVERQLQLIEQLESNEQDPDQLSNLFQLDHLATRMRRNSENLLVLAGTDLAKRNIAPVPMVDVLRAAVSEVEQYQRIVVQSPPTASVAGRAASDLVHLLAELLDNATNFSPPDSQVVMSTARTADGAILVEIADRGVGMADYELADANERLDGPVDVDVSASRRMGLFVVGRLAQRHRFGVRLGTTPTGGATAGLTVSVTVPANLVPSTEPVGTAGPDGPGARPGLPSPVPPQRSSRGADSVGSLSSMVAGTDGPAAPAGPFEPSGPATPVPAPAGQENGSPQPDQPQPDQPQPDQPQPDQPQPDQPQPDQPQPEPLLPTRKPGSTLRSQPVTDASGSSVFEVSDTGHRPADTPDPERTEVSSASDPETTGTDDGGERRPTTAAPPVAANGSEAHPAAVVESAAADQTPDDQTPDDQTPDDQTPDDQTPDDQTPDDQTPESDAAPITNGIAANVQAPAAPAAGADHAGAATADARTPTPDGSHPDRNGAGPLTSPIHAVAPVDRTPEPDAEHTDRPRPAALGGPTAPGGTVLPRRTRPTQPQPGAPEFGRPTPRVAPGPPPAAPRAPQPPAPLRPGQRGPGPARGPAGPPQRPRQAPSAPVHPGSPSGRPEGRPAERPPPPPDGLGPFQRGETTPIFEEIASAWFRSNRPIPVDWQNDTDTARDRTAPDSTTSSQDNGQGDVVAHAQSRIPVEPTFRPGVRSPAQPPPAPESATSEARTPVTEAPAIQAPVTQAQAAAPVAAQPETTQPETAQPSTSIGDAPTVAGTAEDREFASLADAGWRAASGVETGPEQADVTAAGLPKRRPRARLVPGSAGSAVLATPVSSARSAESIRGRLASYQRGIRQGRENRLRHRPDNAGGPGSGDAEQSGSTDHHDRETR